MRGWRGFVSLSGCQTASYAGAVVLRSETGDAGGSDGGGALSRAARADSTKNSCGLRAWDRVVTTTVSSLDIHCIPSLDWLPLEIFLIITACRSWRSAKLFVRSTPEVRANVHSAGSIACSSRHVPFVFEVGLCSHRLVSIEAPCLRSS